MSFKEFWREYGGMLLNGWLRAINDGNKESFKDWVLGEYDSCTDPALRCTECSSIMEKAGICEHCGEGIEVPQPEEYEVPYHGLLDEPSTTESVINAILVGNRGV